MGRYRASLFILIIFVASLLQPAALMAQAMPKRGVVEVADGVFAATGYASNNMGFIVTDEGLVVIDTGMTPELGQAFLDDIRRYTDLPVRYVIFTHYHYDHTDGASVFQGPGVEFVAQENLVWNLDNLKEMERLNQRVLGEVREAPLVYPGLTYAESHTLKLGGRDIRLFHAMGETSDATLVYVPDARVMFIGDLNNANLGSPVMPEGYAEGFVAAVDLIDSLDPEVLVPGHGRIEDTTLASLTAMREVTVWMMARVRELVGEGYNLEETLAAVTIPPEFAADPLLAETFAACREPYVNRLFKNYTGYYGRNPVTFRPAPAARRSELIAELAGGNARLLDKARTLATDGEQQLALELLDIVIMNEPNNVAALRFMAETYIDLAKNAPDLNWYHRASYFNAARRARATARAVN